MRQACCGPQGHRQRRSQGSLASASLHAPLLGLWQHHAKGTIFLRRVLGTMVSWSYLALLKPVGQESETGEHIRAVKRLQNSRAQVQIPALLTRAL